MKSGRTTSHLIMLMTPSVLTVAVLLGCLATLVYISFLPSTGMARVGTGFFLANYSAFLGDPFFVAYLTRSLWIAVYTTIIVLVLGYVVAYYMTLCSSRTRLLISIILLVQFFTSFVIRTYAVMLMLGRFGVINRALMGLGITDRPIALLFNELAVAIGMVMVQTPYVVFPIYASLAGIEPKLVTAAQALGASRMRIFWEIIFPLSLPGVSAGVVIVFLFGLTAYIMPGLLGGGYFDMIANLIYEQTIGVQNYPLAAAAAMVTMGLTLAVVYLLQKAFRVVIVGAER